MGRDIQVICLLLIAIAIISLAVGKHHPKVTVEVPKLILEYNWPEPVKNLRRLPHPKSCFHFYLTRPDGSHALKKCHGGEIFDYRSLRCREESSAKCWKDIVTKGGKGKLKESRRHFSCPFPWGLYADIEDCSQFYDCLGGKFYVRKCPAFTLFDKVARTCVHSNDAMCADESDIVEPGYKCPYKWGFYTHPSDCSKYYECLRKVPSIRTCGKHMLFDNFKRKCLHMSRVKCGTRLNPYEEINKLVTEQVDTDNTSNIPGRDTSQFSSEKLDEGGSTAIPEKLDKVTQEVPPPKTVNIIHKTISTRSDKILQETTPSTSVKVPRGTNSPIPNKVSPLNIVNIAHETSSSRSDKIIQETTPPTSDKVPGVTSSSIPDKVSQGISFQTQDKVTRNIAEQHVKVTQESAPSKPDKIAQGSTLTRNGKTSSVTIPTSLDKLVQETTLPKSQEVVNETNPSRSNKIAQDATHLKSDKVIQETPVKPTKIIQENFPTNLEEFVENTAANVDKIPQKNISEKLEKVIS